MGMRFCPHFALAALAACVCLPCATLRAADAPAAAPKAPAVQEAPAPAPKAPEVPVKKPAPKAETESFNLDDILAEFRDL